MRTFRYVAARDAEHAVALLTEHGPSVRVLAGGTDLLVELKTATHGPDVVVDVSRAADLRDISLTADGLRIGAAVTHAEIMRSPVVRERFPVLADAAHALGAAQTRTLGTLGGNLVSAVPSMDGGPALLALDAVAVVAGPAGRRTVPLAEFFVAPRRTVLEPRELLVAVVVPAVNAGKPAAFLKFGLRRGQALALVNVAVSLWLDGDPGRCRDPRIALGAVAPTVIRAPGAERFLAGRGVTVADAAEAGRIAADEAKPISDFRASAAYRRQLVAVLTRRALDTAIGRARARRPKSA